MAGPKIKFCGITRPEDARAAAELGADFIGLNFHPASPRRIDLARAGEIIRAIPPPVIPVGLFVDAPLETVRSTASSLGLAYVQLHGTETPEFVSALTGLQVFKAIPVRNGHLAADLAPWKSVPNLTALLLDTGSTSHPGGTGIENDWAAIREHEFSGGFEGCPPIILAGGLRPENVADVLKLIHPWAVDVSSGIESSKGIKSREKMAQFAEAVRGY